MSMFTFGHSSLPCQRLLSSQKSSRALAEVTNYHGLERAIWPVFIMPYAVLQQYMQSTVVCHEESCKKTRKLHARDENLL